MGSLFAREPDRPDPSFLTQRGHKTYVVTSPDLGIIKVGYTGRTLRKGVWNAYRRAYGENMVILRVYPAGKEREDEEIHRALAWMRKDGVGNEIYPRSHQKRLLAELDKWHGTKGLGPFHKIDVMALPVVDRDVNGLTESMKSLKLDKKAKKRTGKRLQSNWK